RGARPRLPRHHRQRDAGLGHRRLHLSRRPCRRDRHTAGPERGRGPRHPQPDQNAREPRQRDRFARYSSPRPRSARRRSSKGCRPQGGLARHATSDAKASRSDRRRSGGRPSLVEPAQPCTGRGRGGGRQHSPATQLHVRQRGNQADPATRRRQRRRNGSRPWLQIEQGHQMIRFSFRMLLAVAFAGVLLPAIASAAPAPTLVTAGAPPITVEVGKGVLVRLDRPANSVFVADPDVADVQAKSPTLIYLFGKSSGETTLFAVGDHDKVQLNATIRVRYDLARIEDAIHQLAPRSAVSVSTVGDALVIDGTVYDAAEGDDIRRVASRYIQDPKQLINRMKVDAPNQVNLRVRVAEVSRDLLKQLGFNWDVQTAGSNFLFGLASGANRTQLGGIFNTRTLSSDLKTSVDNLFGQAKLGNTDLNTLID